MGLSEDVGLRSLLHAVRGDRLIDTTQRDGLGRTRLNPRGPKLGTRAAADRLGSASARSEVEGDPGARGRGTQETRFMIQMQSNTALY